MCRLIALGIVATGVLIVGTIFLVFKFVPSPWNWVLVFSLPLVVMMVMWFSVKYAIKAFMLGLLQTKSKVMKDAGATLLSALPAQKPAGNGGETPERSDDRHHFLLEVTITPKAGGSAMSHWDTDDLRIVDFAAPKITITNPEEAEGGGDDEAYSIERVELREADGYIEPEGPKFHGAQTLRLLVAMKPGASKRVKFRYYFEDFGDLSIP